MHETDSRTQHAIGCTNRKDRRRDEMSRTTVIAAVNSYEL